MGKIYLLLLTIVIGMASCSTSNNNNELQSQQAYIDSVARANAARQEELNRKKNDSTINAVAAARADSMQNRNAKMFKVNAVPATLSATEKIDTTRK